jgi:hypothetical protein
MMVHATNKTGSSSDDWVYWQLGYTLILNYTYIQAIEPNRSFTHFPVYRCTRTRTSLFPLVVSQQRFSTQKLPQSHTSNVTHKVFNSHDPLFSSYEPSSVVSHLELTDNYSRNSFSLS